MLVYFNIFRFLIFVDIFLFYDILICQISICLPLIPAAQKHHHFSSKVMMMHDVVQCSVQDSGSFCHSDICFLAPGTGRFLGLLHKMFSFSYTFNALADH